MKHIINHNVGLFNAAKSSIGMGTKASLLATCTLLVSYSAASAQEEAETRTLNPVVVTAERKSDNLQDIPLAVTALSAEALSDQQIVTTRDLARAVPNLVVSNNVGLGTSVTYFLRGVGSSESIPTFDLPVGTYIDCLLYTSPSPRDATLSRMPSSA